METNRVTDLEKEPLIIVISGPSGVGKDSVIDQMKNRNLEFHYVVTATTRHPRPEELHGEDYYFVSQEEFARMIETDALIEYAFVYKDYKGIPKAQVQQAFESGKDVVMRVDVQGAASIRKLYPEALLIFLTTSSDRELINRLQERQSETADQLQLRIAMARKELKRLTEFDYVVVNRDSCLDATVDTILAIIHAEHHRIHHRKVRL